MLAGINTLCFVACYVVALVLEVTRLFFQSTIRGRVLFLFAGAGLLAHTLFLLHRAANRGLSPLASPYDWYLLAAWLLIIIYLGLSIRYRGAAIGLFLLPLALALVAAAQLADREPFSPARASRFWGNIHGAFLLLGAVAVIVGFVAGVMYLIQNYRLKRKLLPIRGLRMPSLETLQKASSRALSASAVLIGVGFVAGLVLNSIKNRQVHDAIPWSDPVVWSSAVMFAWLMAAVAINWAYRPARQGRKVAYLTMASFGFLALTLGMMLLVDTKHGDHHPPPPTAEGSGR